MSPEFEHALWLECKRFNYGAFMVASLYAGKMSAAMVMDFIVMYTAGGQPYDMERS